MSVTIYSKPNCAYCEQAKQLLNANHLLFDEIILDVGQQKVEGKSYVPLNEFKEHYPEAKSMPQVFVDDLRIGGYVELKQYLAHAA